MATILVKDPSSTEAFNVHREFACHYSPVFMSAFNSAFKEGQTQTYQLEDTSVEAVQLLVQWLYQQKLDLAWVPDKITWQERCLTLVELWVLADKLLIPRLQNEALREIHKMAESEKKTPTRFSKYVYKNTAPGSQLRRYFVDRCAWTLNCKWIATHPRQFPNEFWVELAVCTTQALEKGVDRNKMRHEFTVSDYEIPVS